MPKPPQPSLEARKQPRQPRSRFTVDAMVEAATRILERDGLAALTTNRVAELAGVSVGSLYQYFPNKDALLAALMARDTDDLVARIEAIPPGSDGAVEALVDVALDHQFARPAFACELDRHEARLADHPLLLAQRGRIVAAVAARLPSNVDASVAADLVRLVQVLVDAVDTPVPLVRARIVGAVNGYLAAGHASPVG
ncbi:MAG: TetR/AcrR family transcriptional regulator [Silanimonas sp.]